MGNEIDLETREFLLDQLGDFEKALKRQRNFNIAAAITSGVVGIGCLALKQIPVGILFLSSAVLSATCAVKNQKTYKFYKQSTDLIRAGKYEEYVEKYANSDNPILEAASNLLTHELSDEEINDSDIFPELAESFKTEIPNLLEEEKEAQKAGSRA